MSSYPCRKLSPKELTQILLEHLPFSVLNDLELLPWSSRDGNVNRVYLRYSGEPHVVSFLDIWGANIRPINVPKFLERDLGNVLRQHCQAPLKHNMMFLKKLE